MGRDKSLLVFNGATIISHVARVMTSVFRDVVIVDDHSEKYRFLDLDVIPDLYKEAGPLGGIHAALAYSNTEAVFISPCDTPLLTQPLIEHILEHSPNLNTSIPLHDGILQPLCGLYSKLLLPLLQKNLEARRFKVTRFLHEIEFSTVEITPELPFYSPSLFNNVNRPVDFKLLQRLPYL